MSIFIHPDSVPGDEASREDARLNCKNAGIVWPAEPWTCPHCRQQFDSHAAAGTVATLDIRDVGEHPERTTFRCFVCEGRAAGVIPKEGLAVLVPPEETPPLAMKRRVRSPRRASLPRDAPYPLSYDYRRETPPKPRDELVRADRGACDSVIIVALTAMPDGCEALLVESMDGRTGQDVSDTDVFHAWGLLAARLAHSPSLDAGRRELAFAVFERLRAAMAGHDESPQGRDTN